VTLHESCLLVCKISRIPHIVVVPPLAQVAQLDKKGTKLLAIVIRIDDTTDKTSVHLIARSRQQYINANISQTVLADQLVGTSDVGENLLSQHQQQQQPHTIHSFDRSSSQRPPKRTGEKRTSARSQTIHLQNRPRS